MARDHLTILDFSDREFLLVVRDVADADGWTQAEEVATMLDLKGNRSASSRLSWLRRFGAVEREHARDETGKLLYTGDKPRYTQRWRLTELGEAMAMGRLNKTQQGALDKMDDGALLMTARWLAGHASGDSGAGKLVMREWRHGVGR